MTARKLIWGAIVVALLISVLGACWTFFGKHELVLDQRQLQDKIDAKL